MDPIINPWWFYLINLADKVANFSIAIESLLITGSIIFVFCSLDEEISPTKKKAIKMYAAAFAVNTAILIIVPSKETCYQMLVASMATPDNVSAIADNSVEFIGKIAAAINSSAK